MKFNYVYFFLKYIENKIEQLTNFRASYDETGTEKQKNLLNIEKQIKKEKSNKK